MLENTRKIRRYFVLLGCLWIGLFFGGLSAHAQTTKFSVKPIFPENQRDKELGYFDLRVTPGEEQEIYFELQNLTDQELVVTAEVRNAVTSSQGDLNYLKTKAQTALSPTLKDPMSEIVQIADQIQLAPAETKNVPVTLKIPKEPFSGVKMGSISFGQDPDQDDKAKNKPAMSLQTRLAIQIGMVLSESDDVPKALLDLNKVAFDPRSRYPLQLQLENQSPRVLRQVTIETKIFTKKGTRALTEWTDKDKKMAPNSYYDYALPIEKLPLDADETYRVEATVKMKDDKWVFTKEFHTPENWQEEHEQSKNYFVAEQNSLSGWLVAGLVASGLLLITALMVGPVWYLKRQKKEENHFRRHKKTNPPLDNK